MWTKAQLIEAAFGELALAGYEFDMSDDEVQDALRRMDVMLAEWEAHKGIRINYLMPANPDDSDPADPSGVPDSAVSAIYANLAVRLAAGYGKQLTRETKLQASNGLRDLQRLVAMPQRVQMPSTMPVGAGNRRFGVATCRQFFPPPRRDPLPVECNGDLNPTEDKP